MSSTCGYLGTVSQRSSQALASSRWDGAASQTERPSAFESKRRCPASAHALPLVRPAVGCTLSAPLMESQPLSRLSRAFVVREQLQVLVCVQWRKNARYKEAPSSPGRRSLWG